jgi:hypothetical protein
VIADGVHQGYLEVRVAMAAKRGSSTRAPKRPWDQRRRQVRPARPSDGAWVAELSSDMQRLGMVVAGPSPDGPRPGGGPVQ